MSKSSKKTQPTMMGRDHFFIEPQKRRKSSAAAKNTQPSPVEKTDETGKCEVRIHRREEGKPVSPLWSEAIAQSELRILLACPLKTEGERRRLAFWMMAGKKTRNAYVCFYDSKFYCIKILTLYEDGLRLLASYSAEIVHWLKERGATYFSVVHNHVDEPLVPSPDDIRLTYILLHSAEDQGVGDAFLGHYIAADGNVMLIEL